ncbi:hypothetical protein [Actinosynnema sp. ALI-1.44]|uniref:hypothetical protein n=1 Tax=Actinosynnema sp. ALI-1.44 TaxID=1933779 RepID=UPI001178CA59|nr:hypothetical protein [Actinosynnema sp. ALI-1.44]
MDAGHRGILSISGLTSVNAWRLFQDIFTEAVNTKYADNNNHIAVSPPFRHAREDIDQCRPLAVMTERHAPRAAITAAGTAKSA